MAEAFPLAWPVGRPRTKYRRPSQFSTTFAVARDGLMEELRLLGAKQIVLSTNVELRRDGLPYANRTEPGDPGVAVYYTWKGEQYALACDRWSRVRENVQAIRKTVEALRGLDRWGTGEMVRAAFAGFKALPAPGETSGQGWWEVLGVQPDATAAEIERAYKQRAKDAHPDNPTTGDRVAWDALVSAKAQGIAARSAVHGVA